MTDYSYLPEYQQNCIKRGGNCNGCPSALESLGWTCKIKTRLPVSRILGIHPEGRRKKDERYCELCWTTLPPHRQRYCERCAKERKAEVMTAYNQARRKTTHCQICKGELERYQHKYCKKCAAIGYKRRERALEQRRKFERIQKAS